MLLDSSATMAKVAERCWLDIVTHSFLRYTFRDVFSIRFQANFTHAADAALVASSLYIIQLECFSSFFPLKSKVTFLEVAMSGGATCQVGDFIISSIDNDSDV